MNKMTDVPTQAAIDRIDDRLDKLLETNTKSRSGFWYFVSSGFFFMIVGAVTLWVAYYTMHNTHAPFTFILVVVGVAVLLYGTGTQGAGNFETTMGEVKYKIGVAGGAGILAFCVGIGIVSKADDIKSAFQIERKYLRLSIVAADDGVSSFENYVPEVNIDGTPAAVQRNGDSFVVYVPYFESGGDPVIRITGALYYVGSQDRMNKSLEPRSPIEQELVIDRSSKLVLDGSLDFPRYPEEVSIALARSGLSAEDLEKKDERNGTVSGGELPPVSPIILAR